MFEDEYDDVLPEVIDGNVLLTVSLKLINNNIQTTIFINRYRINNIPFIQPHTLHCPLNTQSISYSVINVYGIEDIIITNNTLQ